MGLFIMLSGIFFFVIFTIINYVKITELCSQNNIEGDEEQIALSPYIIKFETTLFITLGLCHSFLFFLLAPIALTMLHAIYTR
jgi:hypothetical protein